MPVTTTGDIGWIETKMPFLMIKHCDGLFLLLLLCTFFFCGDSERKLPSTKSVSGSIFTGLFNKNLANGYGQKCFCSSFYFLLTNRFLVYMCVIDEWWTTIILYINKRYTEKELAFNSVRHFFTKKQTNIVYVCKCVCMRINYCCCILSLYICRICCM